MGERARSAWLLLIAVLLLVLPACADDSDDEVAEAPVEEEVEELDVEAEDETDVAVDAPDEVDEVDDAPADAPVLADPVVALEPVAQGLTSPVALADPGDGSGRLFVVDQIGLIRVIEADGTLVDEPFLDLRQEIVDLDESYDERGLLGLAFHPDYEANGRFFVYYSAPLRPEAPKEWNNTSHLSEFRVSSTDPLRADPATERLLLAIDEPQSNHAGGTVAFGPDGFLYLSLGDGGAAGDVGVGHPIPGNGQDTSTLLGSILRIDVDSGDPYAVPLDNPFVTADGGGEGAEEIFAYGFRNPYRFSFDRETGELYVGDAGQNLFEEIDRVEVGGNYGWRIMEGTHCFDVDDMDTVGEDCPAVGPDGRPLRLPVIEYSHDEVGMVVVGGYVYRGDAIAGLDGAYVFGDWSSSMEQPRGTLLAAVPADGDELWPWERIRVANNPDGELGHFLLGFGEDSDGELYVLVKDTVGPTGDTGQVLRLVPPDA